MQKTLIGFTIAIFSMVFLISCENNQGRRVVYTTDSEVEVRSFVLYSYHQRIELSLYILDSLLENCSVNRDKFRNATGLLERYLGNPNSPYRNERLYGEVLRSEIASRWYDDKEKKVKGYRLDLVRQNRAGSPANDFTFTTPNGERKRLFEIRANRLLLFFYNPECEACKGMKARLSSSRVINNAIVRGDLSVLAIYVDRDEGIWRKHLTENPDAWLEGRDENEFLYLNNIYDLHAIPTIYLLDKDKKVLLKDCMSISDIEERL
jgi:hypothetical protein